MGIKDEVRRLRGFGGEGLEKINGRVSGEGKTWDPGDRQGIHLPIGSRGSCTALTRSCLVVGAETEALEQFPLMHSSVMMGWKPQLFGFDSVFGPIAHAVVSNCHVEPDTVRSKRFLSQRRSLYLAG